MGADWGDQVSFSVVLMGVCAGTPIFSTTRAWTAGRIGRGRGRGRACVDVDILLLSKSPFRSIAVFISRYDQPSIKCDCSSGASSSMDDLV